jgi:hypothetical protein
MPRYRAQVDDGAAAGGLHVLYDRLRAEEVVPQIHCDSLVPVRGCRVFDVVSFVVRGVVDQHIDRPELVADARKQRLDRRDVGQVARVIARRSRVVGQTLLQFARLGLRNIQERYVSALLREALDDRGADAGAAAGDDDTLVAQRRIDGVRH